MAKVITKTACGLRSTAAESSAAAVTRRDTNDIHKPTLVQHGCMVTSSPGISAPRDWLDISISWCLSNPV